jgi:hypothetical protein
MELAGDVFRDGLVFEYRQSQLDSMKVIRTRYDILDHIKKESGINFLEIGTGSGDFAEKVCSSVKVNNLTIVDTFEGYDDPQKRHGKSSTDQKTFVLNRLKKITNVSLLEGDSKKTLCKIYKNDPKTKYDFIYIDANHSFDSVMSDIFWSTMLLAEDGIIGIDDYCFASPQAFEKNPDDPYEVQQAVSAFLNENPLWKIKYFSLNARGFQNIFIGKGWDSFQQKSMGHA